MQKMFRRLLAVVLAAALAINGGYVATTTEAAEPSKKEVVIFHTNDMHGHMDEGIGIARVAAMKKSVENALLLDGGDAIQGAPMATLSSGEDIVELMNLAGYDAVCTGNHEYDYGQEQLLKIRSLADYPMLAANVKKDGTAFLQGTYSGGEKEGNGQYTLLEKNGVTVGVFGLTTQETRTSSNPAGLKGIIFEDEIETAEKMIDALEKEGADVIICLAHLGDTGTVPYTAEKLAQNLTGAYEGKLDAIIDAHSHTIENKVVNGVQISQTGTALENLGKMTLTYDEETDDVDIQAELIPESEFTADTGAYKDIVPDAGIEAALAEISEKNQELLKTRIADTAVTLWGGTINNVAEGRVTETNLGNLVADSMIDAADDIIRNGNVAEEYKTLPIVAMQNGGGIRATVKKGVITQGDIINVLPYGNLISFKVVTPKLLYDILEVGVSGNSGLTADGLMAGTTASGGFPQIGGMRFTYDPNKEKGSKVKAVYLDGETEPLDRTDESRQIIFGSNDYLIAGGNGYTMLADLPQVAEGGALDIMLENTILKRTNNGTEPLKVPVNGNRIVVESDDYTPKNYTASVQVSDENGAPVPEKEILYYVDDASNTFTGTTDADGLLKIENLSDGAHTIGAVFGNREAYVCSYTGTGMILTFTKVYPQIDVDLDKQQVEPTTDPNTEQTTDSNTEQETTTGVSQTDSTTPVETTTTPTVPSAKVGKPDKAKIVKVSAKKKSVKKIKITIKKIKANGYQVAIYKNKKNARKNKKAIVKKLFRKTKVTITSKKLKNKKTLFVKVRAYNLDGKNKKYGAWSKIKIVKRK